VEVNDIARPDETSNHIDTRGDAELAGSPARYPYHPNVIENLKRWQPIAAASNIGYVTIECKDGYAVARVCLGSREVVNITLGPADEWRVPPYDVQDTDGR
jgi:hypothetical protein